VEYRSLTWYSADILWIQALLKELSIYFCTPVRLCDNQSAVVITHNPVFHSRTKHMKIDVFCVRDQVMLKQLVVCHVPSLD